MTENNKWPCQNCNEPELEALEQEEVTCFHTCEAYKHWLDREVKAK